MKFTEIAEAYNANVSNLDEARTCFEEEARNFIQTVTIFINSEIKKQNQDKSLAEKRYWNPAESNHSKGGTTLGFYTESKMNLSIRPAGAKKFKNKGAYISFQISYDERMSQYTFKGVLTNSDEVNEYLDEKLAEIAQGQLGFLHEAYKNYEVHKTKEYVAFTAPLNNQLWEDFGKLIQDFFSLCDKTVVALLQADEAAQALKAQAAQPTTTTMDVSHSPAPVTAVTDTTKIAA